MSTTPKTAEQWLKEIRHLFSQPDHPAFCKQAIELIQDDAFKAARNEADAEWKPQVDRLTREVIVLRGFIDRLHATADEAKTMAIPF